MGVFDTVYVEHDLPDRTVEDEIEFQSKSRQLPICLVNFRIKDDGRLLKEGDFYKFTGGFEIHGDGEYFCTFRDGILQDIVEHDRNNPVETVIESKD